MKTNLRLQQLFNLHLSQSATEQEWKEFWDYVDDPVYGLQIQQLIAEEYDSNVDQPGLSETEKQIVLLQIFRNSANSKSSIPLDEEKKTTRLWPRVAIAVAVVSIIFGVALFYFTKDHTIVSDTIVYHNDLLPGKEGATLTLANGRKIVLANASTGEIAKEDGVSISKTVKGKLVYALENSGSSSNQLNTLSTNKGQTYELNLPDGSKVILNAASSLTYSATLREHGSRRVRLEGEAYFEISKDKIHPFIVESKGQDVEVLGTHFNINAYSDEAVIKTTLVEGSIKLNTKDASEILKPNQQALVAGNSIQISNVDAEYAIAWKNGFFLFNDERLESIMTKISRWYNVEVVYTDPALKSRTFIGTISKFEKVSKVLNMLERTEVASFKIEGNKIIIDKK